MNNSESWKIFISSTSEDLSKIRENLTLILRDKGFEVIRYEDNFIKSVNRNSQDICLDNVQRADFLILILNKNFGSNYDETISITQAEYYEAKKSNIPVIFFIKNQLYNEYKNLINEIKTNDRKKVIDTALLNKKIKSSKLIDIEIDSKLLPFVHELMTSEEGNYASFFDTDKDIEQEMLSRLKDFSFSIYRRLIEEQTNILLHNNEFGRTLKDLLGGHYTNPEVRKIPNYEDSDIDLAKVLPSHLKNNSHVIIQGKAGAGKTTELVRTYLDDIIDEKNYLKKMKLYVRLKDLPNNLTVINPITLVNYQIETMLGRSPYPFLYDDITFHLYFDGLDEIATDPKEKDIKIYLNPEILKHPLVVTSRIEISERAKNILLQQKVSYLVYEIYEWDNKRANTFLKQIFSAYPTLIKELQEEKIQKNIVDLIKNPLIATMFAFIIHENELKWPADIDNQASLFDVFIDYWINRELIRLSVSERSFNRVKKDIRQAWRITSWELYQARGSSRQLQTNQIVEIIINLHPKMTRKYFGNIYNSLLVKSRITDIVLGFIHEQFMEYFIAELFVEYCLTDNSAMLLYLERAIRGDVNDFIRAIWDKYEDKKIFNIFNSLESIYYNQAACNVQMRANVVYYISRIPLYSLSSQIKEFFEKISYESNTFIRNGALYSLVRLGDFAAEERLYVSLSTDNEAASYNRRLHLEYYSDVLPSNNPPALDNENSLWGRCCKELLEHIYNFNDKFVYTKRVDIFTIRNLMHSRQNRGSLDYDSLNKIYLTLEQLKVVRPEYAHMSEKAMDEYFKLKNLWESLSQ